MTLDALVIGCGSVGSGYDVDRGGLPLTHAGAYAAHSGTRLVAGVDPDADARAAFERRWGVPTYAMLDEALGAHEIALASISTPPGERASAIDRLVAAGVRAVWAEKPLAPSAGEAAAVSGRCAAAGVGLQVNFIRRFDPLHRRIAADLAQLDDLRLDLRFGGEAENDGIHAFDLCRFFAGEVRSAAAAGAVAVIELERGEATLRRVPPPAFDCTVYARGFRLLVTLHGEELYRADRAESALYQGYPTIGAGERVAAGGLAEAMMEGVQSLVDHLERGEPLLCDGADGVAAQQLLEAVGGAL